MYCFYLFHGARTRVNCPQTHFYSNLCKELCLFLLYFLHGDVRTRWVAMRLEVVCEEFLVIVVCHLQTSVSPFGQYLSYANHCEE
jgi:hypothetical protein